MKDKIIIISSIIILILAIITIICVNCFKTKERQVARIQSIEETKIEETYNEIDIEELQKEEKEEQNTEQVNIIKDENSKGNNATKNKMPYYIKVNYGAQVVTIYGKDNEGNYTLPIKAMVCSTGVATPTSGVYSIPARWEWLRLKGYVWGHYSTQITGNILFHSVPYLRKGDPASLEYWEYDKLGTYASAGCIRLTVKDAKWIYNNCAKGTKVEFYSAPNPGPLGKPTAKKISSYPDYLRNWDPTDTNNSNPWLTYKPEGNTKPQNEIQNNVANTIKNEIVNEATNTMKNEVVNEVTNTIKNEIVNEVTNIINNTKTNTTSNTTENETTNKIDENRTTENNIVNKTNKDI